MKIFLFLIMCLTLCQAATGQWVKQDVNTTASFRGLSVVSEKIIWASGTGGTVIRTIDGGEKWDVITVPDAEKLDFRDIEAFDANTAYILSIGNGDSSRIYKTLDGGKTWKMQLKITNKEVFLDALACLDRDTCLVVSDPVNERFRFCATDSGGDAGSWGELYIHEDEYPLAIDGEAAFAASGTCLIASGRSLFLVSGGSSARVFRSINGEAPWKLSDTPISAGSASTGIFSIAMLDAKNGVIVGGNYEKPDEAKDNLAFTTDGGETWKLRKGLTGYRSGVTYINRSTIVAVGTNGTDMSRDGGRTWRRFGSENLNVVQSKGKKATWAAGPNGLVVKMK
jgi:photosystem II stability/assembly factor-like uncharacterized protein